MNVLFFPKDPKLKIQRQIRDASPLWATLTLKWKRQELLGALEFNLCYWSWCEMPYSLPEGSQFFIRGIISGNHNQSCIFSLSTQGRLFNPCPEGCVVIMLVSVCECEWVYLSVLCMCVWFCILWSWAQPVSSWRENRDHGQSQMRSRLGAMGNYTYVQYRHS